MALVVTPVTGNTARVECTGCPSVLIVSGVAPRLLSTLVSATELAHDCATIGAVA